MLRFRLGSEGVGGSTGTRVIHRHRGEHTLTFRHGGWWLYPSAEAQGEPVAVADDAAEVWAVVCGLVRTDV